MRAAEFREILRTFLQVSNITRLMTK